MKETHRRKSCCNRERLQALRMGASLHDLESLLRRDTVLQKTTPQIVGSAFR
jgi:hypothetical protein